MKSERYSLNRLIHFVGFFMLFMCFSMVQADCRFYVENASKLRQDIESLNASTVFLDNLLRGRIVEVGSEKRIVLSSLFSVALDNEAKIVSAKQALQNQQASISEPLPISDELAACAEKGQTWLHLSNERRQAQAALIKQKLIFINQKSDTRLVLARQMAMWEALEKVSDALSQYALERDQNENVLLELAQLTEWTSKYKDILSSWLPLYLNRDSEFSTIDQVWLQALSLPSPEDSLVELDALALQVPQLNDWLDTLSISRLTLFKDVSKWRNQALLNEGWLAFFKQMSSPSAFFDGLYNELIYAPKKFIDNLSRPFIKEYRAAAKEDKQVIILLSWFSQLLGLMLLSYALIKMAGGATSWLAKLQQGLIAKFDSSAIHSLFSGVFWLIKPNASWIFILLASNSLAWMFKADWKILSLIAPLGTIYAVFRGLRVLIEWGLTRIYTRSDIFLSSHSSEQLVLHSQKVAWIVLGCVFSWWLAYGTGGGYSIYLISLLDIVVLWLVCLWLLTKYKQPVDKLTEVVLNKKISGDKSDIGVSLKFMLKVAWPLVFLAVHIVDILSSLNEKMMVFDVYRSLSVKLLRVRLESRAEETVEEDETEPDQSYTEWMLRDVADDSLFDVGDMSGVLEPLKKWYADKTDENVTVVVGESGSGKSTLVRRLPKFWEQTSIKILDVPAKLTDAQQLFDQLTDLLGIDAISDAGGLVKQDEMLERQVVVIDSAHNLFMAEVGYFDAYRALMECMNAHLDNIYWVVVLNAPSWTYLSYVFAREQRVSSVFKMPRWSPMDIRKLILSRHKGGKRRLKYNNLLLSAAASSESSSIRAADSRVFNILWEQSGGNPLAAIELWLDAVKVKGRLVEVGVPERPSANLLNGMKDDLYFVYTAIVLHASLSTEEIMLVTHFSEPIVRHAVKQGFNMGMIIRDDSKRYKIDPYWYGSLSGFLHRKNLLWN